MQTNPRITLWISGSQKRSSGFQPILVTGNIMLNPSYQGYPGMESTPYYYILKLTPDYTQYTLVHNNITTVDGVNGTMLKITLAIPAGCRLQGGMSPLILIDEIRQAFFSLYMQPSLGMDNSFTYKREAPQKEVFERILSRYPLEPSSALQFPTTGNEVGLYLASPEHTAELFRDIHQYDFTQYAKVIVATHANTSYYGGRVISELRPSIKEIKVILEGDYNSSLLKKIRIELGGQIASLTPNGTIQLKGKAIEMRQSMRPVLSEDTKYEVVGYGLDNVGNLHVTTAKKMVQPPPMSNTPNSGGSFAHLINKHKRAILPTLLATICLLLIANVYLGVKLFTSKDSPKQKETDLEKFIEKGTDDDKADTTKDIKEFVKEAIKSLDEDSLTFERVKELYKDFKKFGAPEKEKLSEDERFFEEKIKSYSKFVDIIEKGDVEDLFEELDKEKDKDTKKLINSTHWKSMTDFEKEYKGMDTSHSLIAKLSFQRMKGGLKSFQGFEEIVEKMKDESTEVDAGEVSSTTSNDKTTPQNSDKKEEKGRTESKD